MPPHPTDACYCDIIEAGVRNIRRLTVASDFSKIACEADHLAFVSTLLGRYLLYCVHGTGFDESLHSRYWNEVRPLYMQRASSDSTKEMDTAWNLLAFSLGIEYKAQ